MKSKLFCTITAILMAVTSVAQTITAHPWQGKRVAYFGDSITDPRNKASVKKYWSYLQEWLGINPCTELAAGNGTTFHDRQRN